MASIFFAAILLFSTSCWIPAVESQYDSYLVEFPVQKYNLPFKRNNVKNEVINWLKEYVEKPHDTESGFQDNSYNIMTETNCKEVTIDLHIGGSVNHHPGIVEHRYCINIRNSAEETCLHRRLKCEQHLEPIYIQDKDKCMNAPYQHYRPAGCKCNLRF